MTSGVGTPNPAIRGNKHIVWAYLCVWRTVRVRSADHYQLFTGTFYAVGYLQIA